MVALARGISPVRNEAPVVTGEHYRALARGQLGHCLGSSQRESHDFQVFHGPGCFLSDTFRGIKCSKDSLSCHLGSAVRRQCRSKQLSLQLSAQFYLPRRNLAS